MTTINTDLPTSHRSRRCLYIALLISGLAPGIAGCPSLESLPTQAPVLEKVEERTGAKYLLYVPSTYHNDRPWPLIVTCHGTIPYDTADLQMREWARFCELHGILIAAPRLVATKGDFPPPPAKQRELQREDEKRILAMVTDIKQRYNIAESQVFMTGWSAASYTILYTGVRNPEIFRALFIRQGSFDARFMDIPADRIDTWQRIHIVYGSSDFISPQTKACIKWLREQKMYVEQEELPGIHRRIDPTLAWTFFRGIIRKWKWMRLSAMRVSADDPMTLRFKVESIPDVTDIKWIFDDKTDSTELSPTHHFAQPGPHEVRTKGSLKGGKKF